MSTIIKSFLDIATLRAEALKSGREDTAELCARALVAGEDSVAFAHAWTIATCERIERQIARAA